MWHPRSVCLWLLERFLHLLLIKMLFYLYKLAVDIFQNLFLIRFHLEKNCFFMDDHLVMMNPGDLVDGHRCSRPIRPIRTERPIMEHVARGLEESDESEGNDHKDETRDCGTASPGCALCRCWLLAAVKQRREIHELTKELLTAESELFKEEQGPEQYLGLHQLWA
ncbi:unnamed protein product [Symbiodinium pilosum]|uniref:Uncharacterized protein n=1 Tax=Symbiodinium pilosum TaxID=2952 RepID=A0A812IMT7_SYMPI|nr:unnamed protein product [Symbiodinium pilosum]